MATQQRSSRSFIANGFTLLELLLVLTIVGILLGLVLPRFRRVAANTKFSQVRQAGTEIANFINQWVAGQGRIQGPHSSLTPVDFLCREIPDPEYDDDLAFDRGEGWLVSHPLHHRYTGNPNYDAVEKLISPDDLPRNPFNQISYFATANDDHNWQPSPEPGLLYLTSYRERPIRTDLGERDYNEFSERTFRFFYLIYTGIPARNSKDNRAARWYGAMDDELKPGIRRGVFVCRHPDRLEADYYREPEYQPSPQRRPRQFLPRRETTPKQQNSPSTPSGLSRQ